MSAHKIHQGVLIEEALRELVIQPEHWYLDATFGRGGHSRDILALGAKVVAFDFDQEAIERAQNNFKKELASQQLILIKDNFKNMQARIENLQKSQELELSGILFDFGTSTDQLMSAERGFSFEADEKAILDMRMDQNLGVKAADLLMVLGEKQLADILFQFGGENDARRIAKEVQQVKKVNPQSLNYVHTLLEIIEKVKRKRHSKLHPATKTFQALRIAVNDELNNIELALKAAFELLKNSQASNKRLVTIAFHEGEDRLVKNFFKEKQAHNEGKMLYKKPITASKQELVHNPRSRSAKLRVLAI